MHLQKHIHMLHSSQQISLNTSRIGRLGQALTCNCYEYFMIIIIMTMTNITAMAI